MANFADNLGVEDFIDRNFVALFIDQNGILLGIGEAEPQGPFVVVETRDAAVFTGTVSGAAVLTAVILGDRVLDNGLIVLSTEADALWLCSAEPTDYTTANSLKRAAKTGAPFGAPTATTNGSAVASTPIVAGVGTATDLCTHWAAVDTVNSRLLAHGPLDTAGPIAVGQAFTLPSFSIEVLAHG